MKAVIAGVGLEITGALLMVAAFISAGLYSTVIFSWDDKLGKYWSSMMDLHLYVLVMIGLVMIGIGILLSLGGMASKK